MSKLHLALIACACCVSAMLVGDILDDAAKAFGKHDDFRITRLEKDEAMIETPTVAVKLHSSYRNYTLKGFGAPGKIAGWTTVISWNDVDDSSEMYGGPHVKDVQFKRRDGSVTMEVVIDSSHMHVVRTFEFYDGQPYIRIHYDMEAVKDAFCPRQLVAVWVPREMRMLGYYDGDAIRYYRNKRDKVDWFNIDRPDDVPCVVYLNDGGTDGFGVFCPDVASWKKYPGKMLCSASVGGGFSLELNRWVRRDVRVGDALCYDILLSPVKSCEEARALLFRMMGK